MMMNRIIRGCGDVSRARGRLQCAATQAHVDLPEIAELFAELDILFWALHDHPYVRLVLEEDGRPPLSDPLDLPPRAKLSTSCRFLAAARRKVQAGAASSNSCRLRSRSRSPQPPKSTPFRRSPWNPNSTVTIPAHGTNSSDSSDSVVD